MFLNVWFWNLFSTCPSLRLLRSICHPREPPPTCWEFNLNDHLWQSTRTNKVSFTFEHNVQLWQPILVREELRRTSDRCGRVAENSTGSTPEIMESTSLVADGDGDGDADADADADGDNGDLPGPCTPLRFLPTNDSCFFSLMASTWCFVCLLYFLSVSLPGNRLVPIDFGRRKLAKTELSPQPRNTYQVDHSYQLLAHL